MAIKSELSADRERGPGHGLLRISGLRTASEMIEFSLMRNQGTAPYLGRGGAWQATEVWHTATTVLPAGDDVVIPLGPDVIDPIVRQPVTVAYRLTVTTGSKREFATLKINRNGNCPLLGSVAAVSEPTAETASASAPPVLAGPPVTLPASPTIAPESAAEPAAEPIPMQAARRRLPVVAVLGAVVVAGAAAGAWYGCLIEGFGAPRCHGELVATPAAPARTLDSPPSPGVVAPVAAPLSCADLDAGGCLAVARRALGDRQLEPARQLFQHAVQLGSAEAGIELGRMYDPQLWRAETSAAARADWETAVYWYETAAAKGDPVGKLNAGRLLCEHASTGFERTRGLQYLREAVEAGVADAAPLVAACEAKAS